MASDLLYANASISGDADNPTNAHSTSDGTFTTDIDNEDWTHRWGFDNPTVNDHLNDAVSATLRLTVRKQDGTGNPTIDSVQIFDSTGSIVTDSTGWTVTNSSSEQITISGLSMSSRTDVTGDSLEVEIVTSAIGGSPPGRAAVQVDEIRLDVDMIATPPTQTFTQTAFRIRSIDADPAANANTDWAAAVNTNANQHCDLLFRIRIEVETNTGGTEGFILRYSYEGGSYVAVPGNAAPFAAGGDANNICMAIPGAYTDGAATTDLLTGAGTSSETFIAGTHEDSNATGTVAFTEASHTEFEFTILIRKSSAGPPVSDGDEFEFRLYNDTGGALDTYTQTPKVIIGNRSGHVGGAWIESSARNWIVDDDKNIYYLTEKADVAVGQGDRLLMWKSTDGGVSFVGLDHGNQPNVTDIEAADMEYNASTDTIHIGYQGPGDDVYYATFNTAGHASPDQWNIDELVETVGTIGLQAVAITHRDTDNDTWIFYQYDEASSRQQVYARRKPDGSAWGTRVNLDSEASTDIQHPLVVQDSNEDIHIFYHTANGTVGEIWHQTISNGQNTIDGTRTQVDQSATIDAGAPGSRSGSHTPPNVWTDGATEKVGLAYIDDGDDSLYWNESAVSTPGWSNEAQITTNAADVNGVGSDQVVATSVIDDTDDEPWVFWSDNETTDQWRLVSDTEVSGSWGTDTERDDGRIGAVRAVTFTHSAANGSARVIGMFIHDTRDTSSPSSGPAPSTADGPTGFVRYIEIELSAGGSTTPQAVDATTTLTATIVKNVGKNVAATTTVTPALSTTSTFARTLAATTTVAAAFIKNISKAIISTTTVTPALTTSKTVLQAITSSTTVTAVLVTSKTIAQAIDVTFSNALTLVKNVGKNIAATTTVTPGLSRLNTFARTIAATTTVAAGVVKNVGKTLAVTTTVTPALVQVREFARILAATTTVTAALNTVSTFARIIAATTTVTATMLKKMFVQIDATTAVTAALIKKMFVQLDATTTVVVTLTAAQLILKAINATTTVSAALTRKMFVQLDATTTMTPLLAKTVGKLLAVATTLSVGLTKRMYVALDAVTTFTADLATNFIPGFTTFQQAIDATTTLTALVNTVFTAVRNVDATSTVTPGLTHSATYLQQLDATSTVTPAMVRQVSKTLGVAVSFAVQLLKNIGFSMDATTTITPSLIEDFVAVRTIAAASTVTPSLATMFIAFDPGADTDLGHVATEGEILITGGVS